MQGYFYEMNKFIGNIIENKDIIDEIHIENTANTCRQFTNIVINVKLKHYDIWKFYIGKDITDDDIKEKRKRDDANITFYHNKYKWDCHNWIDLVTTVESMYFDLLQTLRYFDIKVKVYYNILGHNNYENISDDNFFDARQDAMEMDFKEFLKSQINFNDNITIAEVINILITNKKDIDNYWKYLSKIETAINNKKNAYILSKLIENKTSRENYKENKILIEAYDAYLDIKKVLSNKIYK